MLLVERNYIKPVRILEATNAQLPDGVLLRLVYPVCNIGELNANKRMYERELWDLVLQDQDLQEKLSNRNLYGQAEHPKETASDLQLTSHIIHEMWIGEDSKVYQTMDVLDTPCGRIIECLVRAKSRVGVSTRAEGDLEEAVDGEGNKFHRVVPKSYRYVTTDFTADPSTFGAMAVDVKKNVISAARTAAESKTSKKSEIQFARHILESLECDHKGTCQKCGACKCRKGEYMTKSTVAEAIKCGKLIEGKDVTLVFGSGTKAEKKYTNAKIAKIIEGVLNIQVDGRSLTADGSTAVTIRPDGTMDIFAATTDPYADVQNVQDELSSALSAEEPSPEKEIKPEIPPKGEFKPAPEEKEEIGKPMGGEKEEEVLPESKTDEGSKCTKKEKEQFKVIKKSELKAGKSKERAEEIAGATVTKQKNETKLIETVEGLKSVFVSALKSPGAPEDHVVWAVFEGLPNPVALVHLKSEAEATSTGENIAKLTKTQFEGTKKFQKTEDDSSRGTLEALIDLRVKEACIRAERDTLLEGRNVQLRVLIHRLKESALEITGLRSLLEKKTAILKESKKPDKDDKKINENLQSQHVAHQRELVETANNSILKGQTQVLKEYFERRLSACRLEADDNTQALLECCKSLEDVDQLIENLVQVAQRGALHPHAVKGVVVRERLADSEQNRIDRQVGGLMQGWSA